MSGKVEMLAALKACSALSLSKKTVSAYLYSEQILPSGFARHYMALTSQVMYVFSVFLYFCIFCKMLVHRFLDISENQNVHIIWVWRICDPWHFTDNVTSHKPYYRVGMSVM